MSSTDMSTADFARKLGESGLLSPHEINTAMDTVAGSTALLNGGDLARRLVSAGKLTSFQAEAVLEQRPQEIVIGNYEVLERLGAGAMGTVYKARHRRMKRIVALKVLSPALAKDAFVSRFQREVETLAQLTHPNIIMAFDADVAEIGHFLVMEFVDGRDLATIVEQNGRLSPAQAMEAIVQAARGLEYAHSKSIVHRDIKPANIMWDVSGTIKVADLGLARLEVAEGTAETATAITQAGSIVGTVDYMAPEQAVDSTLIDHRVDIYALGCTLYFLLTGKAPYQGNSMMAVLLKHRDAPIPSLREARPDAPAILDALVTVMLAKQPDQRIGSMSEVIQVLERAQADLQSAAGAGAVERPISELTVILVEPSRTQAAIVRKYLQELGIDKVHHAGSGKQALELARQHSGQVLLSSMHLDDMTGMQLARSLRADETCSAIGFVLTTSGTEAEDLAALRAMPHTALVSKPFDAQKLAAALAAATGGTLADRP